MLKEAAHLRYMYKVVQEDEAQDVKNELVWKLLKGENLVALVVVSALLIDVVRRA